MLLDTSDAANLSHVEKMHKACHEVTNWSF